MENFGKLIDGRDCHLYTIENEKVILKVSDYGASIVSLILKEKNVDIIQGFDSVDGYINDVPYMGGSIGRVCNRIGYGKFVLNDKTYNVTINNGPNSHHGGKYGFDKKLFSAEVFKDSIILKYLSKDKEEGYPGNLNVTVIYKLLESGFEYSYEGISDQDTLFSMTNHAFFNFNGPTSTSALDHIVQTDCVDVACVNSDGLTLDEVFDARNTPFDFRKAKSLEKDINENHKQLINGSGYDHHYVVGGEGYRKMVSCFANDIKMDIYSDSPGFHLYTGNFLDGKAHGKQGGNFPRRSAVCFETQYYPNAINYNNQTKPILKANEVKKHKSEFIFTIGGTI